MTIKSIDWTASKVSIGMTKDHDRRRKLAALLLSLDAPMPYSNADCEIKAEIGALVKEMAADGTDYLRKMYGDAI
jgi:hypothetical protein